MVGSLGDEAAQVAAALPTGRGYVCDDADDIPRTFAHIFRRAASATLGCVATPPSLRHTPTAVLNSPHSKIPLASQCMHTTSTLAHYMYTYFTHFTFKARADRRGRELLDYF